VHSCSSLGCSTHILHLPGMAQEVERRRRARRLSCLPLGSYLLSCLCCWQGGVADPFPSGFQDRMLLLFICNCAHVAVVHGHAWSPFGEEHGQCSEVESFTQLFGETSALSSRGGKADMVWYHQTRQTFLHKQLWKSLKNALFERKYRL